MKKRNGMLRALLCILAMAVLVAPVAAGLTITDSDKITATDGVTSPVITLEGEDFPADGTIIINVSSLNAYVESAPLTDLNVEIASDAVAATWSGVVDAEGINLTLTSADDDTFAGESVTVTFTGAVNPWVADSGGNMTLPLEVTRTDTGETATINFVIETGTVLPPPGGLTITDGEKITSPYGASSHVIAVTGANITGGDTITIDMLNVYMLVYDGIFTDANVVITSDAAAATWAGVVSGEGGVDQIITLTSTGGNTTVGENITVTFTGAGGNPWLPGSTDIYGDMSMFLVVTRTDTGETADPPINFWIETPTIPPGGLTITDGVKITSLDGATSPVITIQDADIPKNGTITINVPDLYLFVTSGTFTNANVIVKDTAAAAIWTRTVSGAGDLITLTSTAGNTTVGENITVTFTGAGGNPWYPDTSSMNGDVVMPLTVTRTDTFQTADPPINFMIETAPPSGFKVAANFSASPTADIAPLTVTFTDKSLGHPTSWSWNFGDGGTSLSGNPTHTYTEVGTYTVNLTATNSYGSDTKTTPWNYINVLNGAIREANTVIEGLTITTCRGPQTITVNTSILPATLSPNNSVLVIQTPGSGFNAITIYAMKGSHFSRNGTLITGNPTGVHLVSEEIAPSPGFSDSIGTNASFNYSIDLSSYPCNAILSTKIWDGVITKYDNKFRQILDGNNAGIVGTAYTAKITKTNFPSGAKVKLHMSVNSSWNTYPNLPGAPGMMFIWWIADDEKSGQVLHTNKLYTDPVNNLDYYEADSPLGLSVFGLSSITGNNNPFQLIAFVVTNVFSPPGNPGSPGVVQTTTEPEIQQATLPDPGTTARIYTNTQGVISQATTLQSTDGLANVSLGLGIVARNSSGMPLPSLSIRRVPAGELPAASPGAGLSFAGMAYDILPDGATFSPAIPLSYTIPQVQWGREYVIQEYDAVTGTWQSLPGSYNPQTGTITAQVSHLCCFALFAKSTEITKAATPEPTIIVASKSPIATDIGMVSWLFAFIIENPVTLVIMLAALAAVAYFGWWKRRL
jgi:PKD repeat protein